MVDRASFTPDAARRIARATKWVEERARPGFDPFARRLPFGETGGSTAFVAQLVNTGPNGTEPDFTDARYWVRRLVVEDTAENEPFTFRFPNAGESDLEFIVPAYNLAEWHIGPEGAGRHIIFNQTVFSPPRIVMVDAFPVTKTRQDGPDVWFAFTAFPGQMFDGYGFVTSCIDSETGCPTGQWVSITGPGVNGPDTPLDC